MKKYIVCLMGLVMALGFVGMSSAAVVTDPVGDLQGGAAANRTRYLTSRRRLADCRCFS